MPSSDRIQNALLTEHFRYTPLTLLDDIINTVNELIFRAVGGIEEGLARVPPEDLGFRLSPPQLASLPSTSPTAHRDALLALKQNEIDTGIHQLETLLNATVDRDFDKFEIYVLRNILSLGQEGGKEDADLALWVKLDHYEELDLSSVSGGDGAKRVEEVQLLRRKLQQTRKLNALLKAEEAKSAAVLAQLRGLLQAGQDTNNSINTPKTREDQQQSPFAFLASAAYPAQPLTQNTQYALAQLPALRALLAKLKSALRTLPNVRDDAPSSGEALRRQRYLDAQARRAFERRGVDADASVRTVAGAGKKVGREDVEGVEAVVQALGGAAGEARWAGDGGWETGD